MSPCQKHWKTQWIMKLHEGPLLKYWCLFSHCYRVLAGPNTYVTYVCIRFARLMFHEYKGMNFQFHWKWDVSLLSSASKKLRKKLYGIGLWHIYIYILVIQLYIIFVHIKYKHCIHTCFFFSHLAGSALERANPHGTTAIYLEIKEYQGFIREKPRNRRKNFGVWGALQINGRK